MSNPYPPDQYPPQYQGGPYPQGAPQPPNPYQPGQQNYSGQPQVSTQARPKQSNPYATRALIYGILSVVLVAAAVFTGRIFIGLLALYGVYYAIRGLNLASRTRSGLAPAIIGLILSGLSVLATVALLILSSLPDLGN